MSTPGDLLGALGREARARLGNGRGGGSEARVYRGRTVEELIPRIQRDLGPEAIVVRRREGLTGGVLGFFQHPWVEIEAVPGTPRVDVYDEPHSVAPPVAARPSQRPPAPPPPVRAYETPLPAAPASALPAMPPAAAQAPPPLAPPAPPPFVPPPPPPVAEPAPSFDPGQLFAREEPLEQAEGSAYVTAHLAALARAGRVSAPRAPLVADQRPEPRPPLDLHELIPEQPRRPPAPIAPPAPAADWPTSPPFERRTVQPGSHMRARAGVEKVLARYGIGEELAAELIDTAMAHALPLAPRSGLAAAVRTTLAQRIPVATPLAAGGASIVLVGAGGAGKTTCCAALLEAYRSSSTLPASFATIIREGEAGELRLLMSPQLLKPTPMESPRALRALRRARSEGLAVLDTPRLSPADRGGSAASGGCSGSSSRSGCCWRCPRPWGGQRRPSCWRRSLR